MENKQVANKAQAKPVITVKGLLCKEDFKKRFNELLGKKAPGFISSVINVSNSPSLIGADPSSIVGSAVVAATMDLPIDPNLGFAYIVPYNDKNKGKVAQFQMGYKGFIQLAMRSGQYKTINATPVYEGDIKKFNRFTAEIEFNEENTDTSKVIGYLGYFRLTNGFEKYLYMTVDELEKHGKKYSQSYKSSKSYVRDNSLWSTNFDAMATKTVLKLLLSKYGILSIEMQTALQADQGVISSNAVDGDIAGNVAYIDNQDAVETTFEEVKEEIKENANQDIIDIPQEEVKEAKEDVTEGQQDMFEGAPF